MNRKITFVIFATLLISACEDEYQRGYKEGYQIGHDEGYQVGHKDGYTEGHKAGYWEGTQFLVQENFLPTAGLGILIALFCAVAGIFIGIFYQSWLYFFKEKWVRYSTLKDLKKLKQSEIFRQSMENKMQAEQFARLKESEIRHSVGMLQLNEKISDMIIKSYPKIDEDSDIYNLYIDIFQETVDSKEISNKHRVDIYSEILKRARNLDSENEFSLS